MGQTRGEGCGQVDPSWWPPERTSAFPGSQSVAGGPFLHLQRQQEPLPILFSDSPAVPG